MVLLILLVLALFVLQTLLPGRFREPCPEGAKGKLSREPRQSRSHAAADRRRRARDARRSPTCTKRCRCSSRSRC